MLGRIIGVHSARPWQDPQKREPELALLRPFHTQPPPPAAVSQTLSTPRLRGLTFNRRGTECFHCPILTRRSGWERGRIVPTLNIKGSFVSASPSAQVRQMSANSGHTRHKIPDEHQLASTESICFKLAAKLHSLLWRRCRFYMAVSYRSVISGVNVPFFPSFFNMWHKFKLLFLPFIHGGLKALKVLLSVSFYSSCLCLWLTTVVAGGRLCPRQPLCDQHLLAGFDWFWCLMIVKLQTSRRRKTQTHTVERLNDGECNTALSHGSPINEHAATFHLLNHHIGM